MWKWLVSVGSLVAGLLGILVLIAPTIDATREQPSTDPAADLITQLVVEERAVNADQPTEGGVTATTATTTTSPPDAADVGAMLEDQLQDELGALVAEIVGGTVDEDQLEDALDSAVEAAVDQAVENVIVADAEAALEKAVSEVVKEAAEDIDDAVSQDPFISSVGTVVEAAAGVSPLTRVGTVNLFGMVEFQVHAELLLILMALASGITGGALMTIIKAARNDDETRLWPYVRWLAGGALAVIVYFLIRGGLLNLGADGATLNPYTIAGLSAIIGMFSENMAKALHRVMEALFPVAEETASSSR